MYKRQKIANELVATSKSKAWMRDIPTSKQVRGFMPSAISHGVLRRRLQLVDRHVAQVSGDRPAMTPWIFDHAIAIAPEHVCHRHDDLGAGCDRAFEEAIDVRDIEV